MSFEKFFAVSTTIVLSVVGSPVPGVVNRYENIATKEINQDLEHQGSIKVELKGDVIRPSYNNNNLNLNNAKGDINSIPLHSEGTKKTVNKSSYQIITSTDKATQVNSTEDVEKTTAIPLELNTETIFPSSFLNVTTESHQPEVTINKASENANINPLKNSTVLDKKNLMEQASNRSQNNDTIDENKSEVTTNNSEIELDLSTQISMLDIKKESTMNSKIETETISPEINTESIISSKSTLISEVATPSWKKYTNIERKRVVTTSDDLTLIDDSKGNTENLVSTISDEPTTFTEKSEVMIKSESTQGRISLQDAITSDIPSLEKLKSDLLSFPKFTSRNDTETTPRLLSTEESITRTDVTTFITTFSPTTSELPITVSSKRAGYLDLTAKNTTVEDDINLKPNDTESLQGPFEVGTADLQDELLEDKLDRRVESQSQLAEDAIKEELLKEEMLNDKEEISKRHRDEGKQMETDTPSVMYTNTSNTTQFIQPADMAPDENLSVRPINLDKGKNTILYPVNPNYKPLKKIEVQPAKPFVRDPDDNSWRNESLSSLGIVFKPKNSSKPFTQVLKNKTETEWNNLLEKDTKSEVPDLRMRLEQMAQKRKSKKKKFDSFGNVFYTDYEENSSSEENTSTPQVEDPSLGTISTTDLSTTTITMATPIDTTSFSTPTAPILQTNDAPALTTTATPTEKTQTTPKKEPIKFTTLKPPKVFNLFDYYETNDDEDIADYLNMAKIDLKKFTVPLHTTYTPYTSPPIPFLYSNPMTQYTPERKGTIQYFPPRTTKRPKKNKHNNIRDKVNPLTLTDSPKHVLPISYHKLTTPYGSNVYYANSPDMPRFKNEPVPKNFDRNLYLTTPPLTTTPDEDFGVITNEGGYNRPNYVIKHYKDYINEAQQQEHDKQSEYAFTEPPAITAADFGKSTTSKDKTTVTEDYDYESEFRKDLLDRFVANFNEKSNRFKSDFPVVYNNSIVHGTSYDEKDVAMSRAYFRRPYSNRDYKQIVHDPYDPNCENVTVELSPAYELHYYVPDQEEKQEVEAKPIDMPVRYRL